MMTQHRAHADLGAIAEVLKALDLNGEKAKGVIAQWMSMVHSEVLGYVETMVKQIHAENEVVLRQLSSTLLSRREDGVNDLLNGHSDQFSFDTLAKMAPEALPKVAPPAPSSQDLVEAFRPSLPADSNPRETPPPPSTPAPNAAIIAARLRASMREKEGNQEATQNGGKSHTGVSTPPMVVNVTPSPRGSASKIHAAKELVHDLSPRSSDNDTTDSWRHESSQHPVVEERASDAARKNNANKRASFIANPTEMKEQVRELLAKPNAADIYKETGLATTIVKHSLFETCSLIVISLNAVWIAIDLDLNNELLLVDSPIPFQVVEHVFCVYFTLEWLLRFHAYKIKKVAFQNHWFLFDTALVSMMVFETWIINICVFALLNKQQQNALGNDAAILKIFRLARLTRVARCVRILRSFPELVILIKGLWVASRSVMFTLVLLFAIIYIFAIAFRQITDGLAIGDKYFSTVPQAIGSLLLRGTLPDLADLVYDVGAENVFLAAFLFLFILFASLTVMNMLVGVLVEVVKVVSTVEQEELMVSFVKTKLYELVSEEALDGEGKGMLQKAEFMSMLTNARCARFIRDCGVDVVGLVEFTDLIFRDKEEIELFKFVELILQLRGSNNATVKDLVDMRKFFVQELRNCVVEIKGAIDTEIASALDNVDLKGFVQCGSRQSKKKATRGHVSGNPSPPCQKLPSNNFVLCNGDSSEDESLVKLPTARSHSGMSVLDSLALDSPPRPPMVPLRFTPHEPAFPPTILHLPSQPSHELFWDDGEDV